MRKLYLCLLGAAAFTVATAANATVTIDDTSFEATDGPDTTGSTTTVGYTDTALDNPSFSEFLTFTNDLAGVYSLTLSTSSLSVDFTSRSKSRSRAIADHWRLPRSPQRPCSITERVK